MADRQIFQLTEKTSLELTDVIPIQSANGSVEARSTPMSVVATTVLGELSTRVTYAELVALINAANLIVGKKYIIRDYQTIHIIPNTSDINVGPVEPLIVTATQSNKIDCVVQSTVYPNDIIYYSLTNNNAIVNGSTKGYIYRRIDTVQNNDLPFDFREVKFRRWQMSITTEDATGAVGNYTRGQIVKQTGALGVYVKNNNKTSVPFTETGSWTLLPSLNLFYCSPTPSSWDIMTGSLSVSIPCTILYTDYKVFSSNYATAYNNTIETPIETPIGELLVNTNTVFLGTNTQNNNIASKCYNNTVMSDFFQLNNIGINFHDNLIGQSFSHNSIDGNCTNNICSNGFYRNNIKFGFSNNLCGNSFTDNIINIECNNNTFGSTFNANDIGQYFAQNTFGFSCYKNTIYNSCTSNVVGDVALSNTLASFFSFNTIGDNFRQNNVCDLFQSINLSAATKVYESVYCQIVTNNVGYILIYYTSFTQNIVPVGT